MFRVLSGCRSLQAGSSLKAVQSAAAPKKLSFPSFSTISAMVRSGGFNPQPIAPSLGQYQATEPLYRREARSAIKRMDFNRNIRDCKRRLMVDEYEVQRKLYKAFCHDLSLPIAVRDKFRLKLTNLPRSSSITRVRNRCVYTGRPRAVYRKFKMSRIVFRDLAGRGQLQGVQKASW